MFPSLKVWDILRARGNVLDWWYCWKAEIQGLGDSEPMCQREAAFPQALVCSTLTMKG